MTHKKQTQSSGLLGKGEYLYMRVLLDEFNLKSTLKTIKFKRNLSGRRCICEYSATNSTC